MSVSEKLSGLMSRASYLWIDSPLRASCFLAAAALLFSLSVAVERLPAWTILNHAASRPGSDNWEVVSANLTQSISSGRPIILLVGGSATREMTGKDGYFSSTLSQACGRPLLFVNGGTSNQNLEDSMALTSAVPDGQMKLIVIGLNYYRLGEALSRTPAATYRPDFPFPYSKAAANLLGDESIALARPLNQLGWLLLHASSYDWTWHRTDIAAALPQTPGDDLHNMFQPPALPISQKHAIIDEYVALRWPTFEAGYRASTELWKRFAASERDQGVKVVFLALPESPSMAPVDRQFGPFLERSMKEFRQAGFEVFDWRTSLGLSEADVYDQQHLLESGRRKTAPHFLSLLSRSLHCERATP